MKKISRKSIITIVLFLIISSTFSTVAFASWYGWSSATFKLSTTGTGRYYDGSNVGLNWGDGTHNSIPTHINNEAGFNIRLERKGFFGGYSKVGEVNVPRAGGGNANWTNVGSGTYRFVFTKADDGTTEYVTDIEMFSW